MTEMKKIVAQPRVLPVILVLDTSGSMVGEKIEALNGAVDELREQLSQLRRSEDVDDVRVGVLRFSNRCEWVTGERLVPVDELEVDELEAGGMTNLGAALRELDAKLSFGALLPANAVPCLPVVIFMTDGAPTDDWRRPLEGIRRNRWYENAVKGAVAVGGDADADVLAELVGGEEHVTRADDGEQLRQLLPSRTMICCRESVDVISARTSPEPKIDGLQDAADRDVWEEAEDT